MKKLMMTMLVLAGCGAEKAPGLQKDGSIRAELRLQGDSIGQYTNVLLGVSMLRIEVDGKEVPSVAQASVRDLAQAGAPLLATFDVPAGAKAAKISLRFDDYGGYQFGDGSGDALEAGGSPMIFTFPAAWLGERGHAVLHFDVGRSLIARSAGQVAFVPQLDLRF